MELSPMSISNNYEVVPGNASTPWYRKKRNMKMSLAGVIFVISIGALAKVIPRFIGKSAGESGVDAEITKVIKRIGELGVNVMPRKSSKSKELLGIFPNPSIGTRQSPTVPKVPGDDAEYEARVNAAGCPGSQPTKMSEIDSRAVNERRSLHLPFGVPFDAQNNDTLRLLYNSDYVSAFDAKYHMPMWTSFTITGQKDATTANAISWKGDPRILPQETARCEDYSSTQFTEQNILQRPLYPPSFSSAPAQEEANFITNSVPKSLNHTNLLEKAMNQILSQTSEKEGQLNVVMGPAFDLSATAVKPDVKTMKKAQEKSGPLLVPTHIYIITTWCADNGQTLKKCQSTELKTLAYLLPNFPYVQNCEPSDKTISRNAARVVDVENLTGISFFTGLPIYDAIRLRIAMPEVQLS